MAASGSNESFASLFEQSARSRAGERKFRAGDKVEVTIVAIAREAVFGDLGGKQEGMFERVALADADGKLHVELGSRVSAVVESVDFATGQVRLQPVVIRTADSGDIGVAQTSGGASGASPMLVEGARIKGKVTGVERYGVFVQIAGTQGRSGRGLIPTPETATPRGSDLKKHFTIGQDIEAKILNIDETGKIRLSVSALGMDDERGHFEAFKSQQAPAGPSAEGTSPSRSSKQNKQGKDNKPAPKSFGTLGDLLPKIAPTPAKAAKAEAAKGPPARKPAAPAKDQGTGGGARGPKR